ncbi:FixH family protein [Pelagibius sp. Alg239-R121]|uniref:FixH family protein n=1 Tax=Pelagibius sp. Alg239-R121 TaxID=2993448 RepID=UPI0024A6218C|nr:FixH family protein [Pelagibius sp. Alg239-R121]
MKLTMPQTLNGYHVFAAFCVFFVIVIGVNLAMVFLALDSWSGLSTDDAYQRGLRYNKTLEAMAQKDALGWQDRLTFTPSSSGNPSGDADRASNEAGWGRITLEMRDREGELLEGLIVTGQIWRPTNEGFDRPVSLQAVGAGQYTADVAFPLKGNWLVRLTARRDPNRHDLAGAGRDEQAGFVFGIEKRIDVP